MKQYLALFALPIIVTQAIQIQDSIRYCSVLDQDPCESLYQICSWNTMEGVCESQQLRNLVMTPKDATEFVQALNSDEFPFAKAFTSTSDSAGLAAALQVMDDSQAFNAHVFVKYGVYNQYTIASIENQLNVESGRADKTEYDGDVALAKLSSATSDANQLAQALKFQAGKYFLTQIVTGMNPVQFATTKDLLGAADSAQIISTFLAMDSNQVLETKQDMNMVGILGYTNAELIDILEKETPEELAGDYEVTRLTSSATLPELAAGLRMFAGNYAAGVPIRKTTDFVAEMHPEELEAAKAYTSTSTNSQLATVMTMMDDKQQFAIHEFVKYSAFNGYTMDQAIAQLTREPPKEFAGDVYLAKLPAETTDKTLIATALKKEARKFLISLRFPFNYVQTATIKAYTGASTESEILELVENQTEVEFRQTFADLNQLGLLNYSDNQLIDIIKAQSPEEREENLIATGLTSKATNLQIAQGLKSVAKAYAVSKSLQSKMVNPPSAPSAGRVLSLQATGVPSEDPQLDAEISKSFMLPVLIASLLVTIL